MHSIQVIKGRKLFIIIETMFGVSQANYAYPIEELTRHLSCNALRANPNTIELPVIHVADREVKRLADSHRIN